MREYVPVLYFGVLISCRFETCVSSASELEQQYFLKSIVVNSPPSDSDAEGSSRKFLCLKDCPCRLQFIELQERK